MKVVHYMNQFFAGLGGESAAGHPPTRIDGAVGPGKQLGVPVAVTLTCGDDYFGERETQALAQLLEWIECEEPDVLLCGPAFGSGRYGYACGTLAREASRRGIRSICAMHEENPGVFAADGAAFIVPTGETVAGMREALPKMARLASDLALGMTSPEGTVECLPRRSRQNYFSEKKGADRAIDMLIAKLCGGSYETEVEPPQDRVTPPPPLADLAYEKLALVTEAGVVPSGNPDGLEQCRAKSWHMYSVKGVQSLERGQYQSVHGGFDLTAANNNPNRLVPLDAVRKLQALGRIGEVHDYLYTTTGNCAPTAVAVKFGQEIAQHLQESKVSAVILTGT
jgi:glycine reductase